MDFSFKMIYASMIGLLKLKSSYTNGLEDCLLEINGGLDSKILVRAMFTLVMYDVISKMT